MEPQFDGNVFPIPLFGADVWHKGDRRAPPAATGVVVCGGVVEISSDSRAQGIRALTRIARLSPLQHGVGLVDDLQDAGSAVRAAAESYLLTQYAAVSGRQCVFSRHGDRGCSHWDE